AARALVGQAGIRPNPEVSLEVENIAGTGLYSGVEGTEVTLAASLPIERGNKRQARVATARAELALAELRGELALAELSQTVRERYVAAVAAQARVGLAEEGYERSQELTSIGGVLVDVGRELPWLAWRGQAYMVEAKAELKARQAEALAGLMGQGAMWDCETAPLVPSALPDLVPPSDLLAGYQGLEPRI